jgi:hypothetical protein
VAAAALHILRDVGPEALEAVGGREEEGGLAVVLHGGEGEAVPALAVHLRLLAFWQQPGVLGARALAVHLQGGSTRQSIYSILHRIRIHERTILLRFRSIILRVLRLEVSVNQFQTTFAQRGGGQLV